jgi:hypothetical protein
MVKQLLFGIGLVMVATLGYYVPTYFASSRGIDLSAIDARFYQHYIYRTSGAFFLTAVYAVCFFSFVPHRFLVVKLFALWLAIAETVTFFIHVYNMFFYTGYRLDHIILTLVTFGICCLFFFHRAIFKRKSDEFNPEKTYIVRFAPKNIYGLLNHIVTRSGHTGIYQDGFIYKFRKKSNRVEQVEFTKSENMTFKEIEKLKGVGLVIGKEYRPFKYNCNHMVKDALQHSTR